jgi:hypothetical protein
MKEQVIHHCRVLQAKWVQHIGQGKHHVQVSNRQQVSFPCHYPSFFGHLLALWAMTVSTTVVGNVGVPTIGTLVNVATQGFGATLLQGCKYAFVISQRVVLPDKLIARKPDYIGHLKGRRVHCP